MALLLGPLGDLLSRNLKLVALYRVEKLIIQLKNANLYLKLITMRGLVNIYHKVPLIFEE